MKYTVNKENKTVDLLPSTFTAEDLLQLVEEFKDFSFLVSSAQKSENKGMIVGANYVQILGNTEHN